MTGNRVAHPVLISLANLLMDFKSKVTNRAFMLLVLLPVPKFIEKSRKIRGVLESCLIHECLDFVLKPLKTGLLLVSSCLTLGMDSDTVIHLLLPT